MLTLGAKSINYLIANGSHINHFDGNSTVTELSKRQSQK